MNTLVNILFILVPLLLSVAYLTYFERKVLAAIQLRHGPSVVGPFGLLQPFADAIKLLIKEPIIPFRASTILFIMAPMLTFILALIAWAVIPFGAEVIVENGQQVVIPKVIANINVGVLYVLAISSLGVYGVIIAGWSSNSNYAFLGAIRSAAQMISYEVSIGLIVAAVVITTGTLNLGEMVVAKHNMPFWVDLLLMPIGIIFFISLLAETNRHPFDLPEAEAELVSGYNVEYSSMPFALFFLGEYANMILASAMMTIFFLGGWYPPLELGLLYKIPGLIWFVLKIIILLFVFIWIRATIPRYRYDQLMRLGWKVFLPISVLWVILISGCCSLLGICLDPMFNFPNTRLRRRRSSKWVRNLTSENSLSVNDLVLPLFVHDREETTEPISGLPDVKCYSIDGLVSIVKEAKDLGINAVAIFPVVDSKLKSENAEEAYNSDNLICRAICAVKLKVPEIGIIADIALDPYTIHGHDGILKDNQMDVENDETVSILCKQALALAASGCDVVAPSDMMDGRIGRIRKSLDDNNFQDVLILSYAVKYCSSFYAPFRQVVGSCGLSHSIDKSGYQMDYKNAREAMCEIEMDINEGADFIMIKPGMPYLDIIKTASDKFNFPIFAYQVSGEYAMIKAAANNGWLDYDKVIYESLIGFKRAGASAIFTYAALDIAKNLSA